MKKYFTKSIFLLFLLPVCLTNVSAYQSSSPDTETSPPTLKDIDTRLKDLSKEIKESSKSTVLTLISSFIAALLGAGIVVYTSSAQRKSGAKSLLLDSLNILSNASQAPKTATLFLYLGFLFKNSSKLVFGFGG